MSRRQGAGAGARLHQDALLADDVRLERPPKHTLDQTGAGGSSAVLSILESEPARRRAGPLERTEMRKRRRMPSASASFISLCSVAATYSTAASCARAAPPGVTRLQSGHDTPPAACPAGCLLQPAAAHTVQDDVRRHAGVPAAHARAAPPASLLCPRFRGRAGARAGRRGGRRRDMQERACGGVRRRAGRGRRPGGAAGAAAPARLQREAVRGLAVGGVQVQRVRALEGGQARVGQHARVEAEIADVHVAPPARQREQQLRRAGAVVGVHQRHLHRPAQAWRAVLWVW